MEYGLKKTIQSLKSPNWGFHSFSRIFDPIVPQYTAEYNNYCNVQELRSLKHITEMASGLSMPVGFKNGTDGNIQVLFKSRKSASFCKVFHIQMDTAVVIS